MCEDLEMIQLFVIFAVDKATYPDRVVASIKFKLRRL